MELLDPFGKPNEKALVVGIVLEQEGLFCTPVANDPSGDLIDRSGKLNSQMSCHARKITQLLTAGKVYCEGLTLMPSSSFAMSNVPT
jgi:hypothetical protein